MIRTPTPHRWRRPRDSSLDLDAGDTITAVAGRRVTDVSGLTTVMSSVTPGHAVRVTWADTDGVSRTARITTVAG